MGVYPGKVGTYWVPTAIIDFFDKRIKKAYLEIGVFCGIIISVLAEKHPDKRFVGIDAFIPAYCTAAGDINSVVENTKHLKNFALLVGKSLDILPNLKEAFDIIFVDGDHSYKAVKFDSEASWNLLEIGGILAFHDYGIPEVKQAVDELGTKYGLKLLNDIPAGIVYYEK